MPPGHPGKVGAGAVIADKVAHAAGPGVYFAGGNSSISRAEEMWVWDREASGTTPGVSGLSDWKR